MNRVDEVDSHDHVRYDLKVLVNLVASLHLAIETLFVLLLDEVLLAEARVVANQFVLLPSPGFYYTLSVVDKELADKNPEYEKDQGELDHYFQARYCGVTIYDN